MGDMLTTSGDLYTWVMKSGETTLYKNCFAIMNTSSQGECKRPPATALVTDRPVGILQEDSLAAGYPGSFQKTGLATAVISESVSIGDRLVISAVTGRVKPLEEDSDTSGIAIVGCACSAGTTAGDEIVIQLTPDMLFHS